MGLRRSPIVHALLLVAILPLYAGRALAQNENENVGFRPNHVFESGQFGENIDTLNGGLNLTVPIGQRFQVNSRLGTSLTLSYNSKVWDTGYYRSSFVINDYEVIPNAEGPFGIGFAMNMGRIFVDWHYNVGCDQSEHRSCYTGDWKWVSPDGTQHEIYNYANLYNQPPDPGVAPPPPPVPPSQVISDVPVFTRRATSDLSYALISGPGDQYCYDDGTSPTGCFRVETPDGLVYTLAKRVDCPEPGITTTIDSNKTFQNLRGDGQSFCGWYTRLIEDTSVGTRTTNGSGQTTVPYPNNVQVTYDSRGGFEHAIATIVDSTGRSIVFHNCAWRMPTEITDPNAPDQCLAGSQAPGYSTTDRSRVATYQIDLPANASDSAALHAGTVATYKFWYRFDKIKKAHPDFELPEMCSSPDCFNGQLLTHDPVLELTRIDYPAYAHPGPGQAATEEYSLYYDYSNNPPEPPISLGNYGEITCRTLPVLRKSASSPPLTGNACAGSGAWARFDYTYDYYEYIAAVLSGGAVASKPCTPSDTCDGAPGSPPTGRTTATGTTRQLKVKMVENPAGSTLGQAQWTYTRYGATQTNPSVVVVTDPLQNDTVYLYRASTTSSDTSIGSLPQDGFAPEWDDGMNYEIDYYLGTGATRKLLRSEIREYDADHDTVHWEQLAKTNTRPKRVTTRYHDDGGRDQIVTRNSWDGFGHWRVETESGFDVSEPRTTRSAYSDGSRCSVTTTLACDRGTVPSLCPSGETCDANPSFYETDLALMKEVSDGMRVLTRSDSVYTSRGKLVRSIQRDAPPGGIGAPPPVEPASQADWLRLTQRPGDVMTEFVYSNYSGNAISKTLSTGRAGDPIYAIKYTYMPALGTCTTADECGGYLATKVFLTSPGGPAASWKAIDRVRDANTGLIIATRDTAGVRTDYDYDALGRVGAIRPTGEQQTTVDYVSLLETTVTQGTRGSNDLDPIADFVFTRYLYDGLGRQVATQKRPADPTRGFACQKTQHDVMNNVLYQTELKYDSTCAPLPVPPQSQCFAYGITPSEPGSESDYRDSVSGACDPFGRARLQIAADADRATGDKVVRTEYFGTSTRVTVNSVRAAGGAAFPVTTAYLKDALGRLLTVDESSGKRCSTSGVMCSVDTDCGGGQTCVAADGGADASYTYDAADRLIEVTLTDNLLNNQTRRFGYDGLGHQVWAENPENGTTTSLGFDALGNPLAVQDARGNVQKFHYDYAGRSTDHDLIAAGNVAETLLSRNVYDEGTGGTYPLGKVTSVFSYDQAGAATATERRTYSGLGGRLSAFSLTFPEWGDANKETTTYSYTTRGEVASIGYPQETPSIHTPLVIDYGYANGQLRTATEDGTNTILGQVTYNPAGGIETVTMPGLGRTATTFDVRNRPSTITAGVGTALNWGRIDYTSGTYAYDGAGNIYQIGANRYGYDAANRLITAHTEFDGTSYDEAFTYDIYGNMQQRQRTTVSTTSVTEVENFGFGAPPTNQIVYRQTTVGSTDASAVPFHYDPDGNMVEGGRRWNPTPATTQEDVNFFQYDSLNRLLRIQQIGDTANHVALSEVNTFAYDASGNRIRKTDQGGSAYQYYVRDAGGRVLSEFRSAGTTATREWTGDYVYLGDRLLALKENLRPRTVTRLTATQAASPTPNKWRVTLHWTANPESDVQSYKVYRLAQGIDTLITNIGSTSSTNYPDLTDFNPGVVVRYEVAAVRPPNQENPNRPQVILTTGDTTGPPAPTLAGSVGDGRVVLTWTPNDSTAVAYEVQRRTTSTGTPYVLTSPAIAGMTFIDTNLVNGSMYFYKVRAMDAAGNWGPLSCQPVGLCDLGLTPRDLAPPAVPKGLVAAPACAGSGPSNQVMLTWEANPTGDGVVSYEVHRNTSPAFDATTLIDTVPGTSYADPAALTVGTTYYYAVRALDNATPTANRSAFTPPVGTFIRDASLTPQVAIQARGSDGSVGVHWQQSNGVPSPMPTKYLIYRKPSAVRSCAAYELIGDVPYSYLGDYTDGSVANNAAYDYAMTAVVGTSESGFSRAGLGVPLARPRNIVQCAAYDPWNPSGGLSTVVSWTAPEASFYQPLYATTTDNTFGYLKGYHLYHHKVCDKPYIDGTSGTFINFKDNSPLRIVVPTAITPSSIDPYLVDSKDGQRYDLADPRYLINEQSTLEPYSTWPGANQSVFNDCNLNQNTNCAMPKAVYKIFADGTWMTVESDWPDYFNPLATDPGDACSLRLTNPYSLASCADPGAFPSFVPPPRKITATATEPGAITLSWVPPNVATGKPAIAGYYLYARSYLGTTDRHSFRAPLPFAAVGPTTTSLTLDGLGASARGYTKFSVATVDEAGHVSGPPGRACTMSGVDCSADGSCPQKYCKNTSVTCTTDSNCSTYGQCTVDLNSCAASSPCAPAACLYAPHGTCTLVDRRQAKHLTNGEGSQSMAVTLNNTPVTGNTLIAWVITRGTTTGMVSSISQTGANWSKADEIAYNVSATYLTGEIWYASSVNGAASALTLNFSSSVAAEVIVAEYSGIVASGALDRTVHQGGSGLSAATGSTDQTSQGDEVWIGALGSAVRKPWFSPTSGYTQITQGMGSSTNANRTLSMAMYEKYVTTQGTASMSASLLTPGGVWVGMGATFRTASQNTCGARTWCSSQVCQADTCTSETCADSIGRWCQTNPNASCTTAADCPGYTAGTCNASGLACDPTGSPTCGTGQICVPGDACTNNLDTASVIATQQPGQPAPPAALKTVLWTVNDAVVGSPGRGRDGIKVAWVAGPILTVGPTIQGYRVYRSTTPGGPYCALLDTGTHTPPLPTGVSVCTSDAPGHTVDDDALSTDYSSAHRTNYWDSQFYWDRAVAPDRIYYYRVSQVELNGTLQETPFDSTNQVAGRALGYDPDVLPPPQGFRAGASQSGSIADMESVALRWCPPPAATDLPTVTEYRVYRKPEYGTVWSLAARLAPSCLVSTNRCEINPSNACSDLIGTTQPCSIIQPTTGCDTGGSRCGVIDHAFPCWPFQNDPPETQRFFNWDYYVTSVSQLGTDPPVESAPSEMNRAWLNYCGTTRPAYPNDCPPASCTPTERRDPDGNTDTGMHNLVCGDEDSRLIVPQSVPGIAMPGEQDLAPHRIIGVQPCDEDGNCGGGGGGGNPYNPPARWVFYHLDHLGSVRAELDANGSLISKHHYLPFGDERPAVSDTSLNTRAFTGHERDKESGLDYMSARYYSSSLARFLSPDSDSSSALPMEPQTWNRYAYVENNPITRLDPLGRSSIVSTALQKAGAAITSGLKSANNAIVKGVDKLNAASRNAGDAAMHAMSGLGHVVMAPTMVASGALTGAARGADPKVSVEGSDSGLKASGDSKGGGSVGGHSKLGQVGVDVSVDPQTGKVSGSVTVPVEGAAIGLSTEGKLSVGPVEAPVSVDLDLAGMARGALEGAKDAFQSSMKDAGAEFSKAKESLTK